MTNADKIRAMTDAELAHWMITHSHCDDDIYEDCDADRCLECALLYLESEVKS